MLATLVALGFVLFECATPPIEALNLQIDARLALSTEFPEPLFRALAPQLGALSKSRCEKAIVKQALRFGLFTAYFTNRDECDGGNSYGVVVRGEFPNPAAAVAVIIDSEVMALGPAERCGSVFDIPGRD